MTHDRLVHWMVTHVQRGWTPEEISGRLPVEFPDDRTTIERKSRYFVGVKLQAIAAEPAMEVQPRVYQGLPAHAVRSITVGNGSEFAHHYKLADTIRYADVFL
jgi:hypothetical protein